jgi:hypothetical protein
MAVAVLMGSRDERASRTSPVLVWPTVAGLKILPAELGQHTAWGIFLIGVKQMPPAPVDNFTPVKKIPMTIFSMVTASKSGPSFSLTSCAVSSRIAMELSFQSAVKSIGSSN